MVVSRYSSLKIVSQNGNYLWLKLIIKKKMNFLFFFFKNISYFLFPKWKSQVQTYFFSLWNQLLFPVYTDKTSHINNILTVTCIIPVLKSKRLNVHFLFVVIVFLSSYFSSFRIHCDFNMSIFVDEIFHEKFSIKYQKCTEIWEVIKMLCTPLFTWRQPRPTCRLLTKIIRFEIEWREMFAAK